MTPITREEIYLAKLAGETVTVPTPVSRNEMYLAKACGETVTVPDPVSREEMYLYKLAGGSITLPTPVSRLELLMAAACGEAVVPYDPVSRLEWFWSQIVSPTQTITGVPPLTFISDGTALSSWIIYGNGQQSGTPTPDAPITPDFVGTLSDADWTIPITCAGQTVPVYLGQTQTVRKIGKKVLDGTELIAKVTSDVSRTDYYIRRNEIGAIIGGVYCTHLRDIGASPWNAVGIWNGDTSNLIIRMNLGTAVMNMQPSGNTVEGFKEYLAAQYAAGTPVTIWYVLANEQTGIVNEPLAKIGDYADELHSEDATVTIQTVSGINTLTIGTDLQPSSVSITGHISQ